MPWSRRQWMRHALAALPAVTCSNTALASIDTPVTPRTLQPRPLRFPRDHGAHPQWRTEWWYLTGWLENPAGALWGFQVTFFRTRVDEAQGIQSRLAAKQLLMAHAALSDIGAAKHWHDQRLARWNGLPPTAPDQDNNVAEHDTDARVGQWRLWRAPDGRYHTRLSSKDFALDLQAKPTQGLLLQGKEGFSQKGPDASQASFYVTEPQLQVQGTVRQGKQSLQLKGRAWLDHEWSEALLHPQAVGWDWVGMNLDDGSTLTAFQLRRGDGSALWVGGSWRAPGQSTRVFAPGEVVFEPLRHWNSPRHRARYPVQWRLITPVGEWSINSLLDDQEMGGLGQSGPVYWEGLSELLNPQSQRRGLGYLEMTGYSAPLVL